MNIMIDVEQYRMHMLKIYESAVNEYDKDFILCRNPAVILYKYNQLSNDELKLQCYDDLFETVLLKAKKNARL